MAAQQRGAKSGQLTLVIVYSNVGSRLSLLLTTTVLENGIIRFRLHCRWIRTWKRCVRMRDHYFVRIALIAAPTCACALNSKLHYIYIGFSSELLHLHALERLISSGSYIPKHRSSLFLVSASAPSLSRSLSSNAFLLP